MSFDSPAYLLFLPLTALAHWLLPSRWRWAALLAASYVFYAGWDAKLSLLILAVTVCSYLAGLFLERINHRLGRRLLCIGTVAVCLGLLGYFKYLNLLGQMAAAMLGGVWRIREIILPSFAQTVFGKIFCRSLR